MFIRGHLQRYVTGKNRINSIINTNINMTMKSKPFPSLFSRSKPSFAFSQLNTSSPTTISITMPNLQIKSFNYNDTTTFKDIEEEIKEDNKFTTIEFKTWDNSIISKNNSIMTTFQQADSDPIFLKVNNMEWQLLNLGKFQLAYAEDYDLKKDLVYNPIYELKELTKKITNIGKNSNFTNDEINKIALQLFKIKHHYNSIEFRSKLSEYKNLEDLLEKYYTYKSEYVSLHKIFRGLLASSELKSKLLILFGGLFFVIELALIYYGTFILLSWDITEPMTYLLGCFNVVLIFALKRKMGNLSPSEFFTGRFLNKAMKKKNFNKKHFDEVKMKLKEMEALLNN